MQNVHEIEYCLFLNTFSDEASAIFFKNSKNIIPISRRKKQQVSGPDPFNYTFWFHRAVLFLSLLLQYDYIPACNAQYSFFLHCGDDYGAEALRGHGGLDDVGVLPAGFV